MRPRPPRDEQPAMPPQRGPTPARLRRRRARLLARSRTARMRAAAAAGTALPMRTRPTRATAWPRRRAGACVAALACARHARARGYPALPALPAPRNVSGLRACAHACACRCWRRGKGGDEALAGFRPAALTGRCACSRSPLRNQPSAPPSPSGGASLQPSRVTPLAGGGAIAMAAALVDHGKSSVRLPPFPEARRAGAPAAPLEPIAPRCARFGASTGATCMTGAARRRVARRSLWRNGFSMQHAPRNARDATKCGVRCNAAGHARLGCAQHAAVDAAAHLFRPLTRAGLRQRRSARRRPRRVPSSTVEYD